MSRSYSSARSLPSLAVMAARELAALKTEKAEKTLQVVKPYTPHQPWPKQKAFLSLDAQEALYGGAASGGKSDALIFGALQFVDRPNYSALLMRRQEVDLNKAGAILDRARSWFAGTAAKWDAKLFGFRFPSYDSNPGASISFGFFQHDNDRGKWKGTEYQYIGIDELTEWPEAHYLFMFSRLRGKVGGVPTRMRAGTNPGGVGHEWVWNRFVRYSKQLGTGTPYDDGKGQGWRFGERAGSPYFVSEPSVQAQELGKQYGVPAVGACFVPAFVDDNPAVNAAEYLMNLARGDETEFAWYAKGDWTAVPPGQFFKREWFTEYLEAAPPGIFWIRYWDLAATEGDTKAAAAERSGPAWTAGAKLGIWRQKSGDHKLVIANMRREKLEPGGVREFVKATGESDTKRVQIVIEQDPGQAGKDQVINYQRTVLFGWSVHGNRATGPKETYWAQLAAFAKAGGIVLVRGEWNEALIKELVSLPAAKKDQADACSRGYAWLIGDEGKRLAHIFALANAA